MRNRVFFICIIFLISLKFLTAFSKENGNSDNRIKLKELVLLHNDLKSWQANQNDFFHAAQNLNIVTDEFISNSHNKTEINSSEGKYLLAQHQALVNLVKVKNKLDVCIKDPDNQINVSQEILDAHINHYLNLDYKVDPCTTSILPNILNGLAEYADNMESHLLETHLRNSVEKQVLLNTAQSLFNFLYKFDPKFMSSGKLSKKELEAFLDKVCIKHDGPLKAKKIDICNSFPGEFRDELEKTLIHLADKNIRESKRFNLQSATDALNSSITNIQGALSEVKLKTDEGVLYNSPDMGDKNAKEKFDLYTKLYLRELGEGSGILLLSEKIKNQAGELRQFRELETERKAGEYFLSPHNLVSKADTSSAIIEINRILLEQILLIQNSRLNVSDNKVINKYISENSLALGQTLTTSPELLELACLKINEVHLDKKIGTEMKSFALNAASIAGTGFLLTSASAGAAAFILTGKTLKAGTLLGTINGYANLGMYGAELISLGVYGNKAISSYRESDQLEKSFITQNNDSQSIVEARKKFGEFQNARTNFAISLLVAGYTLPTAHHFLDASKNIDNINPKLTKLMNTLATYHAIVRLKKMKELCDADDTQLILKHAVEGGLEKIDYFFNYVLELKDAEMDKILNQFVDPNVTDREIYNMISKVYADSKVKP